MTDLVERFGVVWLNAVLGATLYFGIVAMAMVLCAQPARRCTLARMALVLGPLILPASLMRNLNLSQGLRSTILVPFDAWLDLRLESTSWAGKGLLLAMALAAIGSVASLLLLGIGWVGVRRYLYKTVAPDQETLRIYQAMPYRRRFRPRLRVSARVRAPVLLGSIRPTILIPPDLEEPGQTGTLRLGLLHELVHAERFDHLFGLASSLCGIVWFFLPPLWWIRGQMRLDQEFLADLVASSRYGARVDYASSLVGMAQMRQRDEADVGAAIGGASLLPRILMLVRCPFPVEMRSPVLWRSAATGLVILLVSLACRISIPGLAEAFSQISRPVVTGDTRHGVLQVARILFEPGNRGEDGQILPYTLLMRLPRRFELAVEVWASADQLSSMQVCGWNLGPFLPRGTDPPPLTEGFHRVRIVADAHGSSVWVAGHPVATKDSSSRTTEFLSLRPAPGQPGRYRNLILAW